MILGIGCDIVKIARISSSDEKFSHRILTQREFECYQTFTGKHAIEYLAGRFAAKEAIFKALPENDITISQIEVLNDEFGKPMCSFQDYTVHISISHEEEYAVAYAMVEK